MFSTQQKREIADGEHDPVALQECAEDRDCACAALAQPEPVEPSDEKLKRVSLGAGDRVLVKDQTNKTHNGIYEIPYFLDGTEEEPMMIALRAAARWGRPRSSAQHHSITADLVEPTET